MEKVANNWSFIHVADIHVGTPRSYRFQPAWKKNWQTARKQIINLNPDFLIVGGDLTRDGATHRFELEQIKSDLDNLPIPYFAIPGNHEVGNKYFPDSSVSIQSDYINLYKSVFGESAWSFVHKGVRFSGFDALLFGSDLPEEKKLWQWLEQQSKLPKSKYHIWFIHPALFIEHLNEPNFKIEQDHNAWYFGIDEPFRSRIFTIFKKTAATHVISAHIHCRRKVVVDSITFLYSPSTAFPQWSDRWPDGDSSLGFINCLITENGVSPQFVPLEKVSAKKGYGPGGNPPAEGRDYSAAWEKPALNLNKERRPKK